MLSTRLCLGVALLSGTQAQTQCYDCTTKIDHMGEEYGLGNDAGCEGNDLAKYSVSCQAGEVCLVDIMSSWEKTGRQTTKILRGCSKTTVEETYCSETFDGLEGERDCRRTCTEDNCNGQDLIDLMADEGLAQQESLSCLSCDKNDPDCEAGNAVFAGAMSGDGDGSVDPMECPPWRRSSCFISENKATIDGTTTNEVHRGCSVFSTTRKCRTITQEINGVVEVDEVCKATCNGENCNEGSTSDLRDGCYTCSYTEDQTGDVLGMSNLNCYGTTPNDEYLQQCPNADDKCGVTVRVDWMERGVQTIRVDRGCVPAEWGYGPDALDNDNTCIGNGYLYPPADNLFKECQGACEGVACNDEGELDKLIDMFEHGDIENCYNCKYEKDYFGNAQGQKLCANFDPLKIESKPCPKWANAACFTAGSWYSSMQGITPVDYEEDHRGCSAFVFDPLMNNAGDCHAGSNGESEWSDCKYTCDTNDCNTKELTKKKQCHVCTSIRNSLNETLGSGNSNCFDAAELTPVEECESEDDLCRTDLELDWDVFGEVKTTVRRGCVKNVNVPTSCIEQQSSLVNFKDCAVVCETSGCNVGMVEVSEKFREGLSKEVDSCATCYYSQTDNGQVSGNKRCIETPNDIDGVFMECPLYARASCYTGSNIHQLANSEIEQVYRGCLFFTPTQEVDCFQQELPINGVGVSFGVCKESCSETNCNDKDHIKPENPGNSWAKCQVCQQSVNERNETIGAGQDGCWNGDSKYDQFCPNEDDLCETEFLVDWFPRGYHTYQILRQCRSRDDSKEDGCTDGGSSSLLSFRDCFWSCDPAVDGVSCNAGMEAIPDEGKDKVVEECYFCQYSQDVDGIVSGSEGCGDFTYNRGTTKCPSYASKSCFNAASFHRDYVANGDFEDDFRGCSPFEITRANACETTNIQDLDHINCKETCAEDNCNSGIHKKRKQCYTCQSSVNSAGAIIGVGNRDCWDNVTPSMLQDCPNETDECLDEMLADWVMKGEQMFSIRRQCSSRAASETCSNGDTGKVQFKDCEVSCSDSACNNNLDVGDKFNPGFQNPSCYTCRYVEDDNHNVSGNRNCDNNPASTIQSCPVYASVGCFTGSATHRGLVDNDIVVEHYKGCSAFSIQGGGILDYYDDFPNPDGSSIEYHTVKSFCTGENCNTIIYKPDTDIGKSMCQVCQVNVDQHNNTIGIGEDRCWEGDTSLEQNCGPDAFCVTELEIDWFARGAFNYRLKRGCSTQLEEKACYDGASALVQFKDCEATCDPAKVGAGCNNGLDAVSEKFSVSGGPASCYHCSYYEEPNGEIAGDINCGDKQEIGSGPTRPRLRCPKYANAACFTAASYHDDYNENVSKIFEDDYRGCSPFVIEDGKQCTSQQINNLKHLNCKETCKTANCNFEKTDSGLLQCYSCSVTLDHMGNQVGIGDPMCLDRPTSESMVTCSAETTECATEIVTDWLVSGKQHVTVRRSCLQDINQPQQCIEGQSPRVTYKDCFDRCEGSGCNDNLEVADKLNDSNNKQSECIVCSYLESDNGDVIGNINCPDSPTDAMKETCPTWANVACFTGSSIHNSAGDEREEVYKGCSTFAIDGGIQKFQEEIGNVEYSLVKESCTTANCNEQHVRPDPIKEKGLSCYTCQISKDHLGNTVGSADESCWGDFPGDHLRARCAEGQICVTELLVDWFTKGNQMVSLIRRCGFEPADDTPINPIVGGMCVEGATESINYKDCFSYCYESGCNYNMNAVLDLHDSGNEIECHACQYGYGYNGDLLPNSNPNCHDKDISADKVPLVKCPKYANAACFTAATFDVIGDEQAAHDYKGCSAFRMDAPSCNDQQIDETNILTTCKSTCIEDGCNNKTAEKSIACYTCDLSFDSNNNTIGVGHPDCLDEPDIGRLQYCWQEDAVCTTDFFVDWAYNGQQYYRLRRGCGSAQATETGCQSGNMIDGQVSYKDCIRTCETSECNTGLEIANDLATGNGHESCYACSYVERDDGTVEGNKFCADAPDKLPGTASVTCPTYADAGCYTGTNLHLAVDGSGAVLEEVYKGCSSFDISSITQWPEGTDDEGNNLPYCYTEEGIIDGNGNPLDLNTCKEFCTEPDCNKYHASPEKPDEPVDDDAFKCFSCRITKDHMGNTIGAGEESCWTNNPSQRFLLECEDPDAVCITNMAIDWAERGEQFIMLSRSCGKRKVTPGGQQCVEERLDTHLFRDCVEYCEDSKCNDWMDGVIELHDNKNDINCYQCQSGFNLDGTTLPGANANCHEPDVAGIIPTVACPRYLNAACFTAATWRLDFDDTFEERDFKGCSGFRLDEGEEVCAVNQIDSGSLSTCKSTCDGDNCNNLTPQKSRQCYVCDVTVDSDEKVLGIGHQSCFANPSAFDLQYCPDEKDACLTEMRVDWDIWGAQTVTIQRRCASSAPDLCIDNGQAYNSLFKDCFKYCSEDSCNDIFDEIASEFTSDNNQEECYSCKYIELEDGTVEGNKDCFDHPNDINAEHKCPSYANAGCYTGSTAFYDESNKLHEEVYKGCSSFEYEAEEACIQFEYDDGNDNVRDVASCKQFCTGNDCNVDHISPDPEGVIRCYSCSAMKDHMGNTLGVENTCWTEQPDISNLVECEAGSVCVTDLVVDWYSHGEQVAILQRRCGPKPSQELPDATDESQCIESQNGQNYFKSCSISCETNQCNKQLDEVINLHDNGNDLECYSCMFGYNYDGNIYPNSNKKCTLPSVVDKVDTIKCPKYMNAACFTASSWDFNWGDNAIEEDYKGCSAFRLESEVCGKTGGISGEARRETCKDTCDTDKCNSLTTEKRLSCYNCEVTVDSMNRTIGFGDFACFENPATRHLDTCANDDTYCKTEMLVDWMGSGQQQFKIKRSCSKDVAKSCSEGTSLNDHIYYKDCEVTCTDSACNTGLNQVSMYFDSGKDQESCYTCTYIEKEDGSVEGNAYCGDESDKIESGSQPCPRYANAGCFTGTNVHYVNQGALLLEQVYKGCSSFTPKVAQSCYNITGVEINDDEWYDYGICKEYCEGKDCNINHKKPDVPPSLSSKRCYQCSTIHDHVGNVLGQTDDSCFSDNPAREYLQACENDDDVCVTDLFVEWQQRGGQRYGVRRRCAAKNTVPDLCLTEENGLYKFKDCSVTCDESGCNDVLEEVLDKHDNGNNNLSCYNCQYGYDYAGNLLPGGDPKCGEESVSGSLWPEACPRYANAGCFTAATWDHSRLDGSIAEEDHKGCSAFLMEPNEPECTTNWIGENEVESCRSTCTDNGCNFETPQRVLNCFVCDVTVDSNNGTIGVGRPECFTNQPHPSDLKACAYGATHCITELEVTWTQRGTQTTRVKRGCSNHEALDTCKQGTSSDKMYTYKDCEVDCDESGCNFELESVAELFTSDQAQDKCLTCSYIEEDNGNVIGNTNCMKPSTNSSSASCPMYANAGCYTGSNTHQGSHTMLHEVYRGCSTFTFDDDKLCVTDTLVAPGGNFDAETCKQYCVGKDDCNDSGAMPISALSIFVFTILLFL